MLQLTLIPLIHREYIYVYRMSNDSKHKTIKIIIHFNCVGQMARNQLMKFMAYFDALVNNQDKSH